jgi:pyridoxamine 5'-phosphate oxidase-like protein
VPEGARPRFPASYGIHAAEAGLIPWSWAVERLEPARNYWVATTRPDGRPHAMPVWGLWLDDTFYFSTSRHSRKARNLTANPEVVVHLESGDEAVIVEGAAGEVVDPTLLARLGEAYSRKYELEIGFTRGELFAVSPRAAYAWQERDYPATATRFSFAPR